MAIRNPSELIIVNGLVLPAPMRGFEIISSQVVDSGRNANGAVVGQLVGRRLWKLNNIQFNGLKADEWSLICQALEPFFVPVTFTDPKTNKRQTVTMYPSDLTGQPFQIKGYSYDIYQTCKFNLIDCGW